MINIVRDNFPNSCIHDLESELPIETKIVVKKIQKVIVDDPRTCIDRDDAIKKVRILRVIDHESENDSNYFNMTIREIVEVIKEYSYDEWDYYIKEIQ